MSYASASDFPSRRSTSARAIRGAEVSREATSAQDMARAGQARHARKAPGMNPALALVVK